MKHFYTLLTIILLFSMSELKAQNFSDPLNIVEEDSVLIMENQLMMDNQLVDPFEQESIDENGLNFQKFQFNQSPDDQYFEDNFYMGGLDNSVLATAEVGGNFYIGGFFKYVNGEELKRCSKMG